MWYTLDVSNSKSAFTIIEIIVVVVIIGVLAAIAMPSYRIQMLKVKNQEAVRVLWALWEAEKDYFRDNGVYTSNVGDLAIDIPTMKNFTNLVLTDSQVQGCGGPFVTNRMSVDSIDSSYRIYLMENGSLFCRSGLVGPLLCPDPFCMKMGFPAQYW